MTLIIPTIDTYAMYGFSVSLYLSRSWCGITRDVYYDYLDTNSYRLNMWPNVRNKAFAQTSSYNDMIFSTNIRQVPISTRLMVLGLVLHLSVIWVRHSMLFYIILTPPPKKKKKKKECLISDEVDQIDNTFVSNHYNDVIMSTMASQEVTSLTIVYSSVYSGADQRKHQSSGSLAFVRGIHRWPVNSPQKGQ